MAAIDYDEFALFSGNAEEFGLAYDAPPVVERVTVDVGGRQLSGLRWGEGPPELVLIHGGAQNAHTWDTVALALGRDLLALDLAGHGHSDGSPAGSTNPVGHGRDLAIAIAALAPTARAVVGMSLGGLSSISLAAAHPELVRQLVLVDITPGVNQDKAAHITAFVNGPASFDSFEDLLERTKAHNPSRSEASLRRGILHNAVQLDDGTWMWRYARHRDLPLSQASMEYEDLWSSLGALELPVLLVRGMAAGSVVDDADEARLLETCRQGSVVRIDGAGHSVQGDTPLELAAVLERVLR